MPSILKSTIDVKAILSFYDEDRQAKKHSNAIKTLAGEELAFALLVEHLHRIGVTAERINIPCTTGKKKGNRLDGWIRAVTQASPDPIYYQVEVKSWSIHGVGGDSSPLPFDSTAQQLATYKKRLWQTYWSNGQFVAKDLNKVLIPMRPPVAMAIVEPLACLWTAVHPDGKEEPFFSVPILAHSTFSRVWVFSVSSFLRNIVDREPILSLNLPMTSIRLKWLDTLFPRNDNAQSGRQSNAAA